MNENIIIYGFGASRHRRPITFSDIVWTMNRYWDYPQRLTNDIHIVRPSLIFQVHDDITSRSDYNTYKTVYDSSGALIITTDDFGFDNQNIMNLKSYDSDIEFRKKFKLLSTVDYMLLYAYWHNFKHIEFVGIDFNIKSEYINQTPSALSNIDFLRKEGFTIEAPNEDEWRKNLYKVDYAAIEAVDLRYGCTKSYTLIKVNTNMGDNLSINKDININV